MAKRFRKLEPLAREGRITIAGPGARPTSGLLGWGSTEGAAREAARDLPRPRDSR